MNLCGHEFYFITDSIFEYEPNKNLSQSGLYLITITPETAKYCGQTVSFSKTIREYQVPGFSQETRQRIHEILKNCKAGGSKLMSFRIIST